MSFLSNNDWFSKLALLFNDGGEATAAEFRDIFSDLKDSALFLENVIPVRDPADFGVSIDSSKVYLIDGEIDMLNTEIEVPSSGITIEGLSSSISGLSSSNNDYTFLKSPIGGSGNVTLKNLSLSFSGSNSKLFNLTGNSGNEAIEISDTNFEACSSLGEISNYRQILENTTGRFGGKPELTLSGSIGGLKISNSIVSGIDQSTTLIKEGTSLSISGRLITDLNCNLSTGSSLLNLSESDFINNEALQIQGAFITRNGIQDPNDPNVILNITEKSIKSNWKNNIGLRNTQKNIYSSCTVELVTNITFDNTFFAIAGTQVAQNQVHFDSPNNGEIRLLTGAGNFLINGNIEISGSANDELILRVVKSEDNGVTWNTEVNRIRRLVNNLTGPRNLAFSRFFLEKI